MKAIQLILIAVLAQQSLSLLARSTVRKLIPPDCQEVHYNVENHGRIDGKIGLLGLIPLSSEKNKEVYDYKDNLVIRRFSFDNTDVLLWGGMINVMSMTSTNHYINTAVPNGCFYRAEAHSDSSFYRRVTFYFLLKKMKHDLFDILGSREAYATNIQWQLDMMIKITKAVRYFHDTGYVHRSLNLENILVDNDLTYMVQNPSITHFDYALKQGEPTKKIRQEDFFTSKTVVHRLKIDPRLDIFSLGRVFFSILNFKWVSSTGMNKFKTCSEMDKKKKKFDFFYCHYFEPLILSMTDADINNRPQTNIILQDLRRIRKRMNFRMHTYFAHYKNMIDSGFRTSTQGKQVPMSKAWIQTAKEKMKTYSSFYEVFLLESKIQMKALYPDPTNPHRVEYYKEHRKGLKALIEMAYERRVFI